MSDNTRIDWADATINPLGWGCYGPTGTADEPRRCGYCYAARLARRNLRNCMLCQQIEQCRAASVPLWLKDNLRWPHAMRQTPERR